MTLGGAGGAFSAIGSATNEDSGVHTFDTTCSTELESGGVVCCEGVSNAFVVLRSIWLW